VAGCCECGDEPSGSCAKELVSSKFISVYKCEYAYPYSEKLVQFQMRQRAEIYQSYIGTVQIRGTNEKSRKICPRDPERGIYVSTTRALW
jgi:hypothetical protein